MFCYQHYIIPGIRTGENSITFSIDHGCLFPALYFKNKSDSFGAHEHGEMTAVPRGEMGLYKLRQIAIEGTILIDLSCSLRLPYL